MGLASLNRVVRRPKLSLSISKVIDQGPLLAGGLREESLLIEPWVGNENINVKCSNHSSGGRFKNAIEKLNKTKSGSELLDAINKLTLFKKLPLTIDLNSSDLGVIPDDMKLASDFKGSGSRAYINFEHPGVNRDDGISSCDKDCILLAHELIHVYPNLVGERVSVYDQTNKYSPNLHEEARTVGLGSFRNEIITENRIREELGLPRRLQYDIVNDND